MPLNKDLLLPGINVVTNNALKFLQENIPAGTEFIEVFQHLKPGAKFATISSRWDDIYCFMGFNWQAQRVYRIEISAD